MAWVMGIYCQNCSYECCNVTPLPVSMILEMIGSGDPQIQKLAYDLVEMKKMAVVCRQDKHLNFFEVKKYRR